MKLGAQVATTSQQDYAFSVSQLEQKEENGAYFRTGGIIWIDRNKEGVDSRLLAAVHECLSARFTHSVTR